MLTDHERQEILAEASRYPQPRAAAPEALKIVTPSHAPPGSEWVRPAIVEAILPTGAEWIVRLKVDDSIAFALIVEEPLFRSQERVIVTAEFKQFHFFDDKGLRLNGADAA